ncbi:MAG: hypothetical protein HETSPECPRED_006934 [Heterodermia speciosa]|uniref:NAD-dependent epimerase/dehydratase domain-containing protein n=1 Tax=Heterodermia speciosa TaxID=116794 RepID=A0A8H3FT11_9LECA|nr:MAG: hypothetical protein HETSPECPRED_006934 [Heterodermia speciosa]
MPNVLVLGATGYIGLPFSQSLLRSGNYTLYGLARTAGKARTLTVNEITPIIGDVSDTAKLTSLISSTPIDIVVDTTSAYESSAQLLEALISVSRSRIQTLANEGYATPKLGFVYVSGTWVHGAPETPVSDLHPVGSSLSKSAPQDAVVWRCMHEQAILAAHDVLDVAIVRPSQIYGRTGWIWTSWWGPLLEAKKSKTTEAVEIPTKPASRPAIVHIDDVVSGMHAVTDRIHGLLGSWPVFDLIGETVLVRDVMEETRAALGVTPPLTYIGPQNPFHEAMNVTANEKSSRAKIVLGWEAKRQSFIRDLPVYVKAWEAAQE